MMDHPLPTRRSFWVYILECADGSLYTGFTINISARLQLHTFGKGAKYTRGRGPFKVTYLREYGSRTCAMQYERRIKKLSRPQKLALIREQMGLS